MSLTLNSSITELILEIGNLLNSPKNNTRTFALEIPNQSFFLEITVKPKQVEIEEVTPYSMNKIMKDEQSVFEKDNNFHKQKQKEKKNPIFKRNNLKRKAKK
jgi:hypothetical protein|nr:MAG TPA: hypothetical protein [Caudoviricetes sp.]